MALRKSLVLAVSAASILFSVAAFAQNDTAMTPDAPATKTSQHAPKKSGTHKTSHKKMHKKGTNTTAASDTTAK